MSTHLRFAVVALLCAVALAACSTTPDCLEPQPYMDAKAFPPLESPPGLNVPAPDPELQIPDVASGPVGHYDEVPANADAEDPAARCLVAPPPMQRG